MFNKIIILFLLSVITNMTYGLDFSFKFSDSWNGTTMSQKSELEWKYENDVWYWKNGGGKWKPENGGHKHPEPYVPPVVTPPDAPNIPDQSYEYSGSNGAPLPGIIPTVFLGTLGFFPLCFKRKEEKTSV